MSYHPVTVEEAIKLGLNPDNYEGDELDLRTAVEDAKAQRKETPNAESA